jgi:hypothetical protein
MSRREHACALALALACLGFVITTAGAAAEESCTASGTPMADAPQVTRHLTFKSAEYTPPP